MATTAATKDFFQHAKLVGDKYLQQTIELLQTPMYNLFFDMYGRAQTFAQRSRVGGDSFSGFQKSLNQISKWSKDECEDNFIRQYLKPSTDPVAIRKRLETYARTQLQIVAGLADSTADGARSAWLRASMGSGGSAVNTHFEMNNDQFILFILNVLSGVAHKFFIEPTLFDKRRTLPHSEQLEHFKKCQQTIADEIKREIDKLVPLPMDLPVLSVDKYFSPRPTLTPQSQAQAPIQQMQQPQHYPYPMQMYPPQLIAQQIAQQPMYPQQQPQMMPVPTGVDPAASKLSMMEQAIQEMEASNRGAATTQTSSVAPADIEEKERQRQREKERERDRRERREKRSKRDKPKHGRKHNGGPGVKGKGKQKTGRGRRRDDTDSESDYESESDRSYSGSGSESEQESDSGSGSDDRGSGSDRDSDSGSESDTGSDDDKNRRRDRRGKRPEKKERRPRRASPHPRRGERDHKETGGKERERDRKDRKRDKEQKDKDKEKERQIKEHIDRFRQQMMRHQR